VDENPPKNWTGHFLAMAYDAQHSGLWCPIVSFFKGVQKIIFIGVMDLFTDPQKWMKHAIYGWNFIFIHPKEYTIIQIRAKPFQNLISSILQFHPLKKKIISCPIFLGYKKFASVFSKNLLKKTPYVQSCNATSIANHECCNAATIVDRCWIACPCDK